MTTTETPITSRQREILDCIKGGAFKMSHLRDSRNVTASGTGLYASVDRLVNRGLLTKVVSHAGATSRGNRYTLELTEAGRAA